MTAFRRIDNDRRAVQRVEAYEAWIAAGSPRRSMPPVPADVEFRRVRRIRKAQAGVQLDVFDVLTLNGRSTV